MVARRATSDVPLLSPTTTDLPAENSDREMRARFVPRRVVDVICTFTVAPWRVSTVHVEPETWVIWPWTRVSDRAGATGLCDGGLEGNGVACVVVGVVVDAVVDAGAEDPVPPISTPRPTPARRATSPPVAIERPAWRRSIWVRFGTARG
jgi:hypothetical protein